MILRVYMGWTDFCGGR